MPTTLETTLRFYILLLSAFPFLWLYCTCNATPLIIDDFAQGAVMGSITIGGPNFEIIQDSLDPSHVVGGIRRSRLGTAFGSGVGTMTFDISPNNGGQVTVDTSSATFSVEGMAFAYGPAILNTTVDALNLDLTARGLDKLRIDGLYFEELMVEPTLFVLLHTINDTSGPNTSIAQLNLSPLAQPYSMFVDLNDLRPVGDPVDLADVDRIELSFSNFETGATFGLNGVSFVPEPTSNRRDLGVSPTIRSRDDNVRGREHWHD